MNWLAAITAVVLGTNWSALTLLDHTKVIARAPAGVASVKPPAASVSRMTDILIPVTAPEGTVLRRDVVPFVGKVLLKRDGDTKTQFSCVLTGKEKRDCVTTAHSFLSGHEASQVKEPTAFLSPIGVTIEFDACEPVYTAKSIVLGTTEIDEISENDRQKDIAIIELSEPACPSVEPAQLLPRLNTNIAAEWLLPSAMTRVPVTIAAFYLGCTLGAETDFVQEACEQYSSTGYIDSVAFLAGEPIYETRSIATLPGSSGAPGLIIDTGADPTSRDDDTYYWICLNVGHRPGGDNACIALENGSFARSFLEARIEF